MTPCIFIAHAKVVQVKCEAAKHEITGELARAELTLQGEVGSAKIEIDESNTRTRFDLQWRHKDHEINFYPDCHAACTPKQGQDVLCLRLGRSYPEFDDGSEWIQNYYLVLQPVEASTGRQTYERIGIAWEAIHAWSWFTPRSWYNRADTHHPDTATIVIV